MAKKLPECERIWVVVTSDGLIDSYPTLLSAKGSAKDYVEENETVDNVFILEAVKVWRVEFPQEPQAEAYEIDLSKLP